MNKLKKTIISLDSWQIKAFLTCPESFKLAFIENLRKIIYISPDKRYTDKGSLVHSILDAFYTLRALDPSGDRLKHGNAIINLIKKNKLIIEAGFDQKFEDLIIQRFTQYLFKYSQGGLDFLPLVRGTTVGVEIPFSVKIFENEYALFILEGRIELISRYSNLESPVFVDHKTQEKISELYDKKIQFLCYAIATGYEYGIINYFGLQKDYKEGETLRQKLIHLPKIFTNNFKKYLIDYVYFPLELALKLNKFERKWSSCSGEWDSHPCQYTSICELLDNKELQDLIKKQNYEVIEPWSPYNLATKNYDEFLQPVTAV